MKNYIGNSQIGRKDIKVCVHRIVRCQKIILRSNLGNLSE